MELSFNTSLDSVPDESLVGSQCAESPSAESPGEFVTSKRVLVKLFHLGTVLVRMQLYMVSVRSPSAICSRIQSSLSEFLVVPTPPGARKQPKKTQFARVLTSSEYLKGLERKEKEKREKEEEKEKKRKERIRQE